MRSGIDAAGQPRDHAMARHRKIARQPARDAARGGRGVARSHHRDGGSPQQIPVAPHQQDRRRICDLAEQRGIIAVAKDQPASVERGGALHLPNDQAFIGGNERPWRSAPGDTGQCPQRLARAAETAKRLTITGGAYALRPREPDPIEPFLIHAPPRPVPCLAVTCPVRPLPCRCAAPRPEAGGRHWRDAATAG